MNIEAEIQNLKQTASRTRSSAAGLIYYYIAEAEYAQRHGNLALAEKKILQARNFIEYKGLA